MILDENYIKELEKAALLPEYIQSSEGDEESEVEVFIFKTMIPFWRVVIFATLHEKMMFEAIMKEMLNAQMPDYFSERLDAEQLFKALCMVDEDCLRYILNKLEGTDSVYNRLLHSVNDKNEAAFYDIINDGITDTRPVVKICNCLRLLYEFYDGVDEFLEKAENSSDDDVKCLLDTYLGKALYKVKTILSGVDYTDETHKVINKIFKFLKDLVDDLLENTNNDVFPTKAFNDVLAELKIPTLSKDLLSCWYGIMLYLYFYMRDGSEFKPSNYTLEVLGGIILTPQYKEIWSEYDASDNAHEQFESVLNEMMDKVLPQENEETQPENHSAENIKSLEPGTIEVSAKVIKDTTEEDNLLEVITEIINKFDDTMFEEPYNKQIVVKFFEELLTSDVGMDFNIDQKRLQESLSSSISEKNKREKSDYTYKGLNIMVFSRVIGYLMKNNVFIKKPMDISKALINIGVKNKKYADEAEAKQPAESISKYIIHTYNEKQASRRSKMVEFILNNIRTE